MADLNGDLRSIVEAVDEASKLHILLAGTKTQPGLIAVIKGTFEEANTVADRLSPVPELSGHIAELKKQIEDFPRRALKTADEMQFRAALQESMAAALGGAIEDARRAAIAAGLTIAREELQAAADEIFGEPETLKAQLTDALETVDALRNNLSIANGVPEHLRTVFFDETEALATTFGEATKAAVDKIKAQNAWLPLKYALCAAVAFVAGFAMHDSIYLQITKFMQ